MSDKLELLRTRRCRHLLSRGVFVNHGLPPGQEAVNEADDQFWCGQNQTIFGPDDEICDIENCCNPSRGCHKTL